MKKVLILLAVSTALLTGCGLFHSDKAWERAKQEHPLEIPPNLDRPDVSDALTIPTVNQQPSSETASSAGASATPDHKALVLKDGVDAAYKRVGMVLEHAEVGSISHSDDATHTYEVTVASGSTSGGGHQGFFARHFSNMSHGDKGNGGASTGTAAIVTVHVGAGTAGSVVSATGSNQAAVSRVMDALRAQLGG